MKRSFRLGCQSQNMANGGAWKKSKTDNRRGPTLPPMEIRQTPGASFLLALCFGARMTGGSPAPQVYSSPIVGLVQTVNSLSAQLLGTYGSATSTNWAGYVVTGATGSVTDVKSSWIVPSIQKGCTSTNTYSLAWVGIDGYTDG